MQSSLAQFTEVPSGKHISAITKDKHMQNIYALISNSMQTCAKLKI
jgi:hypothetical protein